MKQFTKTIIISALLFIGTLQIAGLNCFAQGNQSSFTPDDRERMLSMEKSIIRIEEQLKSQQKEMDTRFEASDDKINRLYTLIYFILGGVWGLIGLIMWDRRSYIKPVKEDISVLQHILKDYSRKHPDLAELLRSCGVM